MDGVGIDVAGVSAGGRDRPGDAGDGHRQTYQQLRSERPNVGEHRVPPLIGAFHRCVLLSVSMCGLIVPSGRGDPSDERWLSGSSPVMATRGFMRGGVEAGDRALQGEGGPGPARREILYPAAESTASGTPPGPEVHDECAMH